MCSGLIQRLQQGILQCKFAKDCKLYDPDSYTCKKGEQNYCGEKRRRERAFQFSTTEKEKTR